MKILIDTNIWISFLLGKRLAFLKKIFENNKIIIYISEPLLDEIKEVANRS